MDALRKFANIEFNAEQWRQPETRFKQVFTKFWKKTKQTWTLLKTWTVRKLKNIYLLRILDLLNSPSSGPSVSDLIEVWWEWRLDAANFVKSFWDICFSWFITVLQ